MFVVFAAVEIRRRTSNSSLPCRNPLNYVERQRKLLVLWRKARNTQKPSNNGSLRPKTASHNGAGKSQPPKPASSAPCGLRYELPKPKGKAWRRSVSGSRRMWDRCHYPKPRFLPHPHPAKRAGDSDRTDPAAGASPVEVPCFKHANEGSG